MDFIVLKVNGKDVSSASHEDTISAFTSAQEPIIVEVLRRSSKLNMEAEPISLLLCDTSTQTEWTGGWDGQPLGIYPIGQTSLIQQTNNHTVLLGNDVMSNNYSPLVADPDPEEDDGCDVEYEEVTLHRSPNEAKLGLTLCYGAADEPDTDIYISEIDPESVAGKDGRIQEGDQLLQINGVDVRSRDQAVSLFSERRPDFTLLLARPQLPVEDYLDDHPTDLGVCQGFNILLEQEEEDATTDTGTTENAHHEKDSGVGRTDESTKNDESSEHEAADTCSVPGDIISCLQPPPDALLDLLSGKDSDSCTDDGALQEEIRRFREQLAAKGMTLAPLCRFQSDTSLDREMALLNKEMENIQLECETLVHRHLEAQQKGGGSAESARCQLEHVYVNLSDLTTNPSRIPAGQVLPLSKQETVERWVNSMILPKRSYQGQQDRDSSSAYNTADSSGSMPLTLELTPMSSRHGELYGSMMSLVSPKMEDKGTQLRESDVASMFSCDSCRKCCRALVERETLSSAMSSRNGPVNNNSMNGGGGGGNVSTKKMVANRGYQSLTDRDSSLDRHKEEKNRNYVTFYPSPTTMYTNQANLQHTMWLQQQMFRQAMDHQKGAKGAPVGRSHSTASTLNSSSRGSSAKHVPVLHKLPPPVCNQGNNHHYQISSSPSKSGTLSTLREDEEMKMEWKVKRRADGTRYITRRPVRNRLLKARAMKILEERAGMTTDDDAMSELKIGRYWSKEERKRHLERARDRKRKEMVIRSKMASVKEQGEDSEDVSNQVKKEVSILELSHKKMMKRRGKVVFDDFTTVQEVLAHGAKVQSTGGKPLGLLTVTTV